MAGVLEGLDFKLASTFQIKNKPMTSGDEVDKLEVFIFIHIPHIQGTSPIGNKVYSVCSWSVLN